MNLVETTWLTRYPWSAEIVYDQGSEFIGGEFKKQLYNTNIVLNLSQITLGDHSKTLAYRE